MTSAAAGERAAVAAAPGPARPPREGLPPGPPLPRPALTALWLARPVELLDACRRRYGSAFTLRLRGPRDLVVVSSPAAIRDVFTSDPDELRAGAFNAELEPMFGRGSLLLLDGERHLRDRRLVLPHFHGQRLHVYSALVDDIVHAELDAWPLGEPFRLQDRMEDLTFEVIMRTVFGVDQAERRRELRECFRRLVRTGGPMLLFPQLRVDGLPFSPWERFKRVRARVHDLVHEVVAERRADPRLAERTDILALLLQAGEERPDARMSDEELRDELITMLFAGHETTATSLAWLFDYVLRAPGLVRQLRSEAERSEERHLDAVVSETLRLRPVIPIVGRKLMAPAEVAGWRLPAGTGVMPALHLLHRREDLFEAPDAFVPERFLDADHSRYAYAPFGGGTRRCVGASFAPHEIKAVVRAVLARARLRLVHADPERPVRRGPSIAPRRGTPVVLEERLPRG